MKVAGAGVTESEARVGTTVMVSDLVAVCEGLLASLTWTVKLKVPVAVGVPLMAPFAGLRVKPGGSDPLKGDQM
jgi:hypothetical protein